MIYDERLIPEGPYCYTMNDSGNTVFCPYYSHIEDSGIKISFCKFLNLGDAGNIEDTDYDILCAKYGGFDELNKMYPLELLWDQCKECGINWNDEEYE